MDYNIFILIGKNIKKNREEKNYTIKDLAITTNLDIDYLEKIEKEGVDGSITFDELIKISSALSVNITDLFKEN